MSISSNVLFALGSVLAVASPSAVAIEVTVATDKPSYHPGEAMYISITAYNAGPEDVTLYFGSTLQAQYTLDGIFTNPDGGSPVITSVLVPAHGSYMWTFRHYWHYNNLAFGTHNVQGAVVGYGASGLASFSVTAPTLPTDNFLVDFDRLPNEMQQVTALEEYWPLGVHVETLGGGSVGIYQSKGNGFAATYSTTYPPGANIVVRFDVPVYGATAEVSTAAAYHVTMVGRDAAGVIIGSETSPTVPAYEEFVGPLRIRSDDPIASLEFWPSITNAAVLIDNLYLSLINGIFDAKNRYLTIGAPDRGEAYAIRVKLTSLMHPDPPNLPQFPAPDFSAYEGQYRWVGAVSTHTETEAPPTTFKSSALQCAPLYSDFHTDTSGGVLHITGRDVIPSSIYDVDLVPLSCMGNEAACPDIVPLVTLRTARFGDVAPPYQQPSPASLNQPDISDIVAIVDKFRSTSTAEITAFADLSPGLTDGAVNIADVSNCVDAFKNFAFVLGPPTTCP